jgi:N-acyl-D-amino-acid deacylase
MEFRILGGTVVDGLGTPARPADVRTIGPEIAEVVPPGALASGNGELIDATGLVVAPGFIDLHSHSDVALLVDPIVAGKLNQGITLEVIGQDGLSVAPLTDGVADLWRRHLGGLTGDYDVAWDWRSFEDYLSRFRRTAANVVALVGHGTIRLNVLGMEDRSPTPSELDRMRALLREALKAGAFGLSGGLVYTPGSYAQLPELAALVEIVAAAGKLWVVHIRYEGDRIRDGLDEMFRLVEQTGVALHVSHFKVMGQQNAGRGDELVRAIEEQRARGMDVTVDQYPYTAGSTMLSAILPPWVHAEGPAQVRKHLADPGALAQIDADIAQGLPGWEGFVALAGWDNVRISHIANGSHREAIGQSLAELAAAWGVAPLQAAARLLLDGDLAVAMIIHAMAERDVTAILKQPWRMGGTDALLGGKPHPRAFGSYPRILGRYVREQGVVSLEGAVRQMTSAAAQRLGLADRGVVAPGMKADLCLFDPATVIDRATFEDPVRLPAGIAWVFVNGEPVLHNREATGRYPGLLLRSGAPRCVEPSGLSAR